jgi:hypothetical protein
MDAACDSEFGAKKFRITPLPRHSLIPSPHPNNTTASYRPNVIPLAQKGSFYFPDKELKRTLPQQSAKAVWLAA